MNFSVAVRNILLIPEVVGRGQADYFDLRRALGLECLRQPERYITALEECANVAAQYKESDVQYRCLDMGASMLKAMEPPIRADKRVSIAYFALAAACNTADARMLEKLTDEWANGVVELLDKEPEPVDPGESFHEMLHRMRGEDPFKNE